MTGVWWGMRAAVLKMGIILTSLSRNFFTDLRKESVDMPKPQFASLISQSANDFFSSFFIKKKLGVGTSIRQSKVTLPFSLTWIVDSFMLSRHNKPAFLALIPPSFTSLNPNSILAVTTVESMRIPGSTPTFPVIYRKCSQAKQAVHTKSGRL